MRFPRWRVSKTSIALLVLVATATAGCARMPSHHMPAMPSASAYPMDKTMATALSSPVFRRGNWPANDWWKQFDDAQLNTLMAAALADNPDLKIARARLEIARQETTIARSGLFPALGANASVTREKFSENGLFPPPIAGSTHNQGQLSLDFRYDLDLWGQTREEVRARIGEAKAAAAEAAQARLVIATTLAGVYFELQGDMMRLAVAEEALTQRQDFDRLVGLRASAGLETQLAVKQADVDVASDQASIVRLQNAVATEKRAIAALTGKGPDSAESISAPSSHFDDPFPVPETLPIDLLARRPDVMARRWLVEASAHEIGVARAGFYPNISLTAQIGQQSLDLNKLLDSGSVFGLVGPAIDLPIFEGWRLRANLNVRYAQYDIAIEQYRRSLIDAARDVADRLAYIESVTQELARQTEARKASEDAYHLAILRYKAGMADYLTVLLVQRDLLRQRDIEAGLRARHLQAVLRLIKALGGGYGQVETPTHHP
ncbi:MAG: efflux transporter outer membrane subunit [Acidiferrobacterales bacterium]